MKIYFVALLVLAINHSPAAQSYIHPGFPEVGKPCPPFFLNNIHHSKGRSNASLEDFRGKWLIIDFFSIGCSGCFNGLPKMDGIQKEFKGLVEVLLVGKPDRHGKVKEIYEKYRKHYDLEFPVAYDSAIFEEFGIAYFPHMLVIDKEGIVRGVTYSLTKENIREFIKGHNPDLARSPNIKQAKDMADFYNPKQPLLIDGNGGEDRDFIYRSILTKWTRDLVSFQQNFINTVYYGNKVQVVGLSLRSLYNLAYADTLFRFPDYRGSQYGKFWKEPILELSDSSEFQVDKSERNRYNYSLIVKKEGVSSNYLKTVMQRDLMNYFGYNVTVEKRLMPSWELVATDKARVKLRSSVNSGPQKSYAANTGLSLRNIPVSTLINHIFLKFQNEYPFFDNTRIEGNIDIDIEAILSDFDAVKKALQKNGLALVRSKREINVIVIRDKLITTRR